MALQCLLPPQSRGIPGGKQAMAWHGMAWHGIFAEVACNLYHTGSR